MVQGTGATPSGGAAGTGNASGIANASIGGSGNGGNGNGGNGNGGSAVADSGIHTGACRFDADCPTSAPHCRALTGECLECTSDAHCASRCELDSGRCVACIDHRKSDRLVGDERRRD